MINGYSLGGLYPWNSLLYTGGLYPLNNSYMSGLGTDFSTILNRTYNAEGRSFCIEFDENAQVWKIREMDSDKQMVSSTSKEEQDMNERKAEQIERQEYHQHRLGGCSWKHRR